MISLADHFRSNAARSQMNYFVGNMVPSVVVVPLLIIGVGGVFMYWFGPVGPSLWIAACIAFYLAFYYFAKQTTPRDTSHKAFQRWAITLVALHTLSELAWASMALWFWIPGDVANNAFLLATMAAHLSVLVGHAAVFAPMLFASIAIPAAALILRPLFSGEALLTGVAVVCIVYAYFLFLMGQRLNRTAGDMLALRDEKDALIAKLENEKSTAEEERTKAEEERSKAEEASQTKSAFLASISHELRTPLNAIIGFSDVMRCETFGSVGHENYKQYAEDIHGSGRHLLSLIDDILDLARIEAGRLELDEEPVDLAEMAQECLRMIEISAANRGIKLKSDIPRHLPRILADNRAIRQLWLNLASNALKFTDGGGTITVFAHIQPDGAIGLGVEDTGCGMEQSELDQVMNAFTHGNSKAHTGERGTGLGLAIVNGLVQAHGGEIHLDSVVGQGTTAMATLPRARIIMNELAAARHFA